MTARARGWLQTFNDEGLLSDLERAMVECMRQVCAHPPAECDCRENLMTPVEAYEWLRGEVEQHRRSPVRFERGHRPRRKVTEQLNLSMAG